MKKLVIAILSLCLTTSVFARERAKLDIDIAAPIKNNPYYLCLYNIGCLNITSGERGVTFPVCAFDMGNITKLVITDVRTMRMYEQPNPASCNVDVKNTQKLTISGKLQVRNNKPYISDLHCSLTTKSATA